MKEQEIKAIPFDKLLDLLKCHKNITNVKNQQPDGEFNRDITFSVGRLDFKIKWYVNICYLYFESDCFFMFKTVSISGTWPNKAKLNLQFYNKPGDCAAVIPIEYYS